MYLVERTRRSFQVSNTALYTRYRVPVPRHFFTTARVRKEDGGISRHESLEARPRGILLALKFPRGLRLVVGKRQAEVLDSGAEQKNAGVLDY